MAVKSYVPGLDQGWREEWRGAWKWLAGHLPVTKNWNWDDKDRRRLWPGARRTPWDWLLPQRHGKFWNFDNGATKTQSFEEIYSRLHVKAVTEEAELAATERVSAEDALDD